MRNDAELGSDATVTPVPGLETLIRRERPAARETDFDVVIVGSGYGGAVAAEQLARCTDEHGTSLSVAVLERGRQYLPGMFPSRMSELAGHVRFGTPKQSSPRGERTGLFDLRIGPDLQVLLASGLGGGSLINAGVMEMPHRSVFAEPVWPREIRGEVAGLFVRAHTMSERLGAIGRGVEAAPLGPPPKHAMLRRLAVDSVREPLGFRPAPITIALSGGRTAAGIARQPCIGCGDCATGCNHSAKNSLDVTLLEEARQAGAHIYTGATVLRLEARGDGGKNGWTLSIVHTDDKLRRRQGKAFELTAQRVILAAGSLGSTELLLRSGQAPAGLRLSKRLGHGFSANGDQLGAVFDTDDDVHAVADEAADPRQDGGRGIGPTITGTIDLRRGDPERDFVIQDLAVPGPLRRLFEEIFTTADTFDSFARGAGHKGADAARRDPCAVDPQRIRRTLPVALIGRDSASGKLHLVRPRAKDAGWGKFPDDAPAPAGEAADKECDGALTVEWPGLRNEKRWAGFYERLAHLIEAAGRGGHALANPLWRPVPATYESMFDLSRGPMMTVHPLGGCAMADDAEGGVVDHLGQVFRCDPNSDSQRYEGLLVLDGAIVPTSLGINPALTIATLAQRAMSRLIVDWKLTQRDAAAQPRTRSLKPYEKPFDPREPIATEIEVAEQLRGMVDIEGEGSRHAELTLRFRPQRLDALIGPTGPRLLQVDPERSQLRLLTEAPDALSREPKPNTIDVVARVSGTLRVFEYEAANPLTRGLGTLLDLAALDSDGAWLRDKAQALLAHAGGWPTLRGLLDKNGGDWERLKTLAAGAGGAAGRGLHALSMLAGVVGGARVLEYDLRLEPSPHDQDQTIRRRFKQWLGSAEPRITGRKRVVLRGAESPWQQLMDMSLLRFPRLVAKPGREPVLGLDLPFFREEGMPLLRVTRQQDQPSAMADVAALLLYVLRMVLRVHLFSFRPPPIPPQREVKRLPGHVPGLPKPRILEVPITTIDPEPGPDGEDAAADKSKKQTTIRLANYRPAELAADSGGRPLPPVLLIHGYSAGGTNFAHPALRPSLAGYLCDRGRDVWIVDMRTSPGMPYATKPWSMERVGCEDIPAAIATMRDETKAPKIDIVAHCMGSAMLFMALLYDEKVSCWGEKKFEPQDVVGRNWLKGQRGNVLHESVRRIAMSQIGPAMIMSPANVARAYLMRYVKQFVPLSKYRFRLERNSGAGQRVLDALLATLPYPPDEMRRHARREPWLGTRLRMDILYGRDFKLGNLSDEVLASIDDFFGPLNVDTVSQAIHFARYDLITDRTGFNAFIRPEHLKRLQGIPMLHIHGKENGLADATTQTAIARLLSSTAVALDLEHRLFEGFGHQDCLIGEQAEQVFHAIEAFLRRE